MIRTIFLLLISAGVSAQSAYVHMSGVTTSASTAPLKLISGCLGCGESNSSFEFDSDGIFFTRDISTEDSLFLSTDKPGTLWEDNPTTLGMKFTTASPGVITALKFYKTDNGNKEYQVSLWDNTGTKLTIVPVVTTATGWIRVPVNIPVGGGTFIIGVYNPYAKYGFRNSVYPRTKGQLTGNAGAFENGNAFPGRSSGSCYYLDIVFSKTIPPVSSTVTPDSVNVSFPWNPVTLIATASNAVSYGWRIEDSSGTWGIDTTNRLKPVITAKSHGNLFLVFTARGADGTEWNSISIIRAEPDPNKITGYLLNDGTIYYRRSVIVF